MLETVTPAALDSTLLVARAGGKEAVKKKAVRVERPSKKLG
jgi:hypothetical protein